MGAARAYDRGSCGRYELVRRLGAGAMGEVWLARHLDTGASAAVKVLRDHAARSASLRRFFERERRAVARLHHPHVVPLFEVGDDFIATAYIDGSDLARRLRAPIGPALGVLWIRQIASALSHAHARGVIHRDVKPSNILIDRQDTAFLSDFGLASLDGAARESIAGTPAYMAPEQAAGEPAEPAADQYALARTLLEILIGSTPPVTRADALAALPASVPGELRAALDRATALAPAERWPTLHAFADALAAVELPDQPAPLRRAPEQRVRTPFRWATGAHATARIGLDIERADYRLSDLEAGGLLDAAACAAFRDATGYRDFGWSVYGRRGRLGPITEPSAPARATEIVVFLHGLLANRDVWQRCAEQVARDNPQALVLAPDLAGFGGSPYARVPDDFQAASVTRGVLRWLELVGLRSLPTVLVGHSMGALSLMSLTDDELGPRTARVAINAVFPEVDAGYRSYVHRSCRALRLYAWFRPVVAPFARRIMGADASVAELTAAERGRMFDEMSRAGARTVARVFEVSATTALAPGHQMRNCTLLIGALDPMVSPGAVEHACRHYDIPQPNIQFMATGGHFPHLDSEAHPEHTARNIDQIVAQVDAMLIATRQGTLGSTHMESTVISDGATDGSTGAPISSPGTSSNRTATAAAARDSARPSPAR